LFSVRSPAFLRARADTPQLRPATPDEIADALAFALRFDGRRRFDKGNEIMAKITAGHLVRYLEQAGFVMMKKPPLKAHRAG
jgi:hypothetical protein